MMGGGATVAVAATPLTPAGPIGSMGRHGRGVRPPMLGAGVLVRVACSLSRKVDRAWRAAHRQ